MLAVLKSHVENLYYERRHTVAYVTAFLTALFIPLRRFFSLDFGVGGGVGSFSSSNDSSKAGGCCDELTGLPTVTILYIRNMCSKVDADLYCASLLFEQ